MDGKGRVSLPAAFRRASDDDRFVLLQWEKPYLSLFPESEWIRFREKLIEYRKSGPGAAFHVRDIMSKAVEVLPDGQGRILIPAWLQEAADLDGSVLLNGNIDRVEIWDPDAYEQAVEARDDEAFGRFARQIFG